MKVLYLPSVTEVTVIVSMLWNFNVVEVCERTNCPEK